MDGIRILRRTEAGFTRPPDSNKETVELVSEFLRKEVTKFFLNDIIKTIIW